MAINPGQYWQQMYAPGAIPQVPGHNAPMPGSWAAQVQQQAFQPNLMPGSLPGLPGPNFAAVPGMPYSAQYWQQAGGFAGAPTVGSWAAQTQQQAFGLAPLPFGSGFPQQMGGFPMQASPFLQQPGAFPIQANPFPQQPGGFVPAPAGGFGQPVSGPLVCPVTPNPFSPGQQPPVQQDPGYLRFVQGMAQLMIGLLTGIMSLESQQQ